MARYLDSFEKSAEAEEPEIPEYYSTTHNRKVVEADSSLRAVLKNPNRIAVAVFAIGAGLIIILVMLILLMVRWRKKRRARLKETKS